MEKQYADSDSADRTDACPDRVGRSYGDGLCGFGKQAHACNRENNKSCNPQPPLGGGDSLGAPETISKPDFTQSGDNQNNPVHDI